MLKKALITLAIFMLPLACFAQEVAGEQENEAAEWMKAATKWKKWADQGYYNDAMNGAFRRKIQSVPEPPDWLPVYCRNPYRPGELELFTRACDLFESINLLRYGNPIELQRVIAQRQAEKPASKSKFWTRVHADFLYTRSTIGARAADSAKAEGIGYFGFHYTPIVIGRFQMFGPPGVLWLKRGMYYTWGGSVRIADVRFPRTKQILVFHLDVVKAWKLGKDNVAAARGGQDRVGMSFTVK
jgi:hypothetical protein